MNNNITDCNSLAPLPRKFKGVWIPSDLWKSKDLTIAEKTLLVEIDSLETEDRGCYALNSHFAAFLGLSASRASEVLSSLKSKGLVRIDNKMDGKRLVERQIFLTKSIPQAPVATAGTDPVARQFRGVWIPAAVWLNESISLTEKVMLAEIDSLQDAVRGCFASNDHFAEFFDLSNRMVSRIISDLSEGGFVRVEQIRKKLLTVERRIYVTNIYGKPVVSTKTSRQKSKASTPSENVLNPIGICPEPHRDLSTTPSGSVYHRDTVREPLKKPGRHDAAVQLAPLEVEQEGKSLGGAQQEQRSEGEFDPKAVPFDAIKDLYNEILGDTLGDCLGINASHKKLILASYNLSINGEYLARVDGLDFWEGLFLDVQECKFLTGTNDRNWKANFSFLINPEKIQAFLEGAYDK